MAVLVLFSLVATVLVFVPAVQLLGVRMLVFRFARGMLVGVLVFMLMRVIVLLAHGCLFPRLRHFR